MQYDATEKLLNTARRRLWLHGLVDRGWFSLILTTGILGLAAVVHTFFVSLTTIWWVPMASLPVAVAITTTVFNRPSLETSARAVDRWLNTHDLLTAAWHLRSRVPRPAFTAAFVVLDQANQVATNASRNLPQLRKVWLRSPHHPLPTAMAIAVAAMSLFFLSLQGAASSGEVSGPVLNNSFTQDQNAEDHWLPVFEPGLTDTSANAVDTHTKRDPTSSSLVSSKDALPQVSPGTEESDQDEPGSNTRSNALQAAKGAGTGRVASKEPPPATVGRETADGDIALADLELITLQRTPVGETGAIDHTLSNELIPFESDHELSATMAQNVSAARAAKEPFSPAVGPAYRVLQARYFEETSPND